MVCPSWQHEGSGQTAQAGDLTSIIKGPFGKKKRKKRPQLQLWLVWSGDYTHACPSPYVFAHACGECMHRKAQSSRDRHIPLCITFTKKKKKTLSSVLPNQMDSTSNIGHGEILKRVFYNGKWKFHSNTAVFQKVLSCTPRNEYITGTICPHPVKFLKPETKLCIGCRVDEGILEHVLIHFPRRNISFFLFFLQQRLELCC